MSESIWEVHTVISLNENRNFKFTLEDSIDPKLLECPMQCYFISLLAVCVRYAESCSGCGVARGCLPVADVDMVPIRVLFFLRPFYRSSRRPFGANERVCFLRLYIFFPLYFFFLLQLFPSGKQREMKSGDNAKGM